MAYSMSWFTTIIVVLSYKSYTSIGNGYLDFMSYIIPIGGLAPLTLLHSSHHHHIG